jgi:hypothetical protein
MISGTNSGLRLERMKEISCFRISDRSDYQNYKERTS